MFRFKQLKFIFLLFFAALLCTEVKSASSDQKIKVALRTIGHEFLLQLDDSTSRVLPIEKIDGRYAVAFETDFSFEPDFLFFAVFKVLEEFNIEDSYVVEVEQCDSGIVIHSFIADLADNQETIACKLRKVPPACYVFYFTFIENEAENMPLVTNDVVLKKGEETAINWPFIVLLVALIVGSIYYMIRKKQGTSQKHLISIGQFQFDQKGMKLNLKAQTIELSSKETDLLHLLYTNENKTLEREHILNVVWGDEGDYVGRTLDVFISKLRKKLEADSNLKIVNVRGVGYRFIME